MNKYIIVRTFCDKREITDKVVNNLLEKRLVAGSQIKKYIQNIVGTISLKNLMNINWNLEQKNIYLIK